ncbi:MAG: HAMP domain-containing sensor histidine kinase [Candidatus Omnitrophota bacterium]
MRQKMRKGAKRIQYRVVLCLTVIALIVIRFIDVLKYPDTEILSNDFFFAVAIAQLFFLWLDSIHEKHDIVMFQKKREELNEMKQKFAMITAHELLTPVTVIKQYLPLMMNKVLGELTEKQEKALEIVNKNFLKLEHIRYDLARLHLGSSVSFEEKCRLFSMEKVIKGVVEDIAPFVNDRKQELSLEIAEGMPEITMAANGISQVLAKLLLNAVRFTPDKGKIIVRVKEEKNNVRVDVEDNGIGIPEDKIQNIFESFYEVQDASKHSSGTAEFKSSGMGIGLAIAKNIMDLHHGKIWVESKEGKFTRFVFTLPKG